MKRLSFSDMTLPFAFLLAGLVLFQATAYAEILRVKPDGHDTHSGESWDLAKRTVTAAINAANQGDEIWVAAGTFVEHIKNKTVGPSGSEVAVDVALYGGFTGTEDDRDQRNWQTNPTILDGGGDSSPTVNGAVIMIDSGATQATRIDGFRITRGHGIAGGGIFIGGSGPVIANNVIWGNLANVGGGILISNYKITPPQVHPLITNNTILYNHAVEAGGGVAIIGSERIVTYDKASPEISGNYISRNISEFHGGGIGIYGHAAPRVTHNSIVANTAAAAEAKYMGNGGGLYATSRDVDDAPLQFAVCAPVIVGNVIAANGANFGGGIHLWDTDGDHGGIPVLTNNTVIGNNGAGISWMTSYPVIQNNLVAYNSRGLEQGDIQSLPAALRNNCLYGNELWEENTNYNGIADQTGINGNISADPKMANYKIGNFRLQTGSPCIDAGDPAAIGSGWKDLDGHARMIGAGVDIGAYESDGTVDEVPSPIYYVRPGGDDSRDGLSWATAKQTVSAAISAAGNTGGEIWVAAGTYVERNILPAFLYLYGGFAGTETSRANRDINANPTILDGGGGLPTVVNSLYAGFFLSAVDGFTIQNGGVYTGGSVPAWDQGYKGRGGGIYCQVSSPLIQNNTIRHNSLGNPFDSANRPGYGGGIYTYLSYALIRNNTITENEVISVPGQGGGIYFFRSMPTILGNTITANRAKYGSAIYGVNGNPRIVGNVIENNEFYNNPYMSGYYMGATEGALTLDMCWDFLIEGNRIKGNTAGATGGTGAGINVKTNFAGRIRNNLIQSNNAKGMGGGIYALAPLNATASLVIVNNTIVDNTGSSYGMESGGGIALSIPPPITTPPYPIPDRVIVANNIIAFNSSGIFEALTSPMVPPTLMKNDIYNTPGSDYIYLTGGATDIHIDPAFMNRTAGDFRLAVASLCVDAGSNDHVPSDMTADVEKNPRIMDGDFNSTYIVDIGAYESFGPIADRAAPLLSITSHTHGQHVSTFRITLAGTASDSGNGDNGIQRVTVNGVRADNDTASGNGTTNWNKWVSLNMGANTITVAAYDDSSNQNSTSQNITIYYDLHPAVVNLVTNYYDKVLKRLPEPGGAEWWSGEIERIAGLGISIIEGFIALGKSFFNSSEYLAMGKSNTDYILDLYSTFLGRTPSQPEIDFFLNYMSQGVSRNEVLNNFIFSPEFKAYVEGIFGASTPRPENTLVNDFYRGILSRPPDTGGFNYWVGQMNAAQCAGSAQQIRDLSHQIALGFIQSNEYLSLGRTDGQFVEDMYDAILRRGSAPWEVSYWLGQLATGTREQVLSGFTGSNEFQTRVDAVIAAGCLP